LALRLPGLARRLASPRQHPVCTPPPRFGIADRLSQPLPPPHHHTTPPPLQDNLKEAGYLHPPDSFGVFYGGDGKQLGVQLLGAASIALWSTALSAVTFYLLRQAQLLRLHVSEELTGRRLAALQASSRPCTL
jgi:hypothetical protein